jgi:pimeloyl-ACP methyl ester carboxylesterase
MGEPIGITHHEVIVNGIRYHYVRAGEGPLVVLLHGFPELWYSFRHQIPALAEAGYCAVAPDLRGFGQSQVTEPVEDYSLLRHAEDVKALAEALGVDRATFVGHDWGANLTWAMALLYPSLVRAVIALSIPFYPQPRDPAELARFAKGRFNLIDYARRGGEAEAEFQENPRRFFRAFFYGLSGDAPAGTVDKWFLTKPPDAKLLDGLPQPKELPPWLTEADIEYYASSFERTGISGALGFYRNFEHDHRALKQAYENTVKQPTLFIGGADEAAVRFGSLEPMKGALPNLRKVVLLPRCGHWVQQERPQEVNASITSFLDQEIKASQREPSPST